MIGKLLHRLCLIYGDEASLAIIREKDREPGTLADLWFIFRNHFRGLTLYNPLGLAAGIVFLATIFRPWWYAALNMDYFTIRAYPFILRHDLPSDSLHYVIETPLAGVVFLLWLLSSYLFLAFWGATLPGRKGRLFLIADGIFMLLYAAGFALAIWFATHRVGLPMTGYTSVAATVQVDIHMHFMPPYYVAMASGALCILSSLVHGLLRIGPGRKG